MPRPFVLPVLFGFTVAVLLVAPPAMSGDLLAPAVDDPVTRQETTGRQQRITALEAELAAARARVAADVEALQDQLVAARDALVAELASRDPVYAGQIAAFRRDVTAIAATPEGLAALARFNEGDRVEAIAALDQQRRARDEARLALANFESAAEARQIATLALDARGRGDPAFDTGAVIARIEAVVRLDPLHAPDWRQLVLLYRAAGRGEDAAAAEARAEVLETSPGQSIVR